MSKFKWWKEGQGKLTPAILVREMRKLFESGKFQRPVQVPDNYGDMTKEEQAAFWAEKQEATG